MTQRNKKRTRSETAKSASRAAKSWSRLVLEILRRHNAQQFIDQHVAVAFDGRTVTTNSLTDIGAVLLSNFEHGRPPSDVVHAGDIWSFIDKEVLGMSDETHVAPTRPWDDDEESGKRMRL